jgi:hypothetical protein
MDGRAAAFPLFLVHSHIFPELVRPVHLPWIVLLLDGTWNESGFGVYDTNIVRVRGHFPNATRQRLREERDESGCATERSQGGDFNGRGRKLNIVFYERGVGTGAFLDRYFGGAFDQGLSTNIRRAYKFLSFHCEPGRSRRQRRRASSSGCRLLDRAASSRAR